MQQGTIAPTEAGVKKKPKARGDKSLLDHQAEQQDQQLDLEKQKMEHDQKLAEKQQKIDEKQGGDLHQQKLQQNDEVHRQRLQQKDAEHKTMLPVKKQALKQGLKQKAKQKGTPGQGRPSGSKDTSKRKARTPKPRTSASLLSAQVMAREAQARVAEVVTPLYLEAAGKKSLRSLTAAQASELESAKFGVLCSLEPGAVPGDDEIRSAFASSPAPTPEASSLLDGLVREAYGSRGVSPTVEDLREMQVAAYALMSTPGEDEDDGEA
jgi:hypothetical protein